MTLDDATPPLPVLSQRGGRLQAVLQAHGGLRSLRCEGLQINLFAASALEAGPANLWLRLHGPAGQLDPHPLLGPSAGGWQAGQGGRVWQRGRVGAVQYRVELVLAAAADAWFWHVQLHNQGRRPLRADLVYLQDVALAPWAAIRLNEAYVSQYLDHLPLQHASQGWVLATRQNAPVDGRCPWLLSGSLGRAEAFATDALQVAGLALRAGQRAGLLGQPLPSRRLQHEHALVALQEQAFDLPVDSPVERGFYGLLLADHPGASSPADLARVAGVLALPEATPPPVPPSVPPPVPPSAPPSAPPATGALSHPTPAAAANLFSHAPLWPSETPDRARLQAWFGQGWRHEETDAQGQVMSFFHAADAHVVSRAHEQRVLRPHGHLLRSGGHWTPDEQAVASTVWMAGVFHSSLTQGHASANRCLSTQRGYLGLFRALGQRVFVDAGQGWRLLDQPSAMQMTPSQVRWVYQAGASRIEVSAHAAADAPAVGFRLRVLDGPALQVLVSHHVAFNAANAHDDGLGQGPVQWLPGASRQPDDIGCWRLQPAPGSVLLRRLDAAAAAGVGLDSGAAPHTPGLVLHCRSDGQGLQVLGDEALFLDGCSRQAPYFCLQLWQVRDLAIDLRCDLLPAAGAADPPVLGGGPQPPSPIWQLPHAAAPGAAGLALGQLADWLPWLAHNALVHYLTPRGLEQFSGGGWGTRDVCQGPAELLLALGRFDALRDLLCRVFSAQNEDGDWPQWFMFYARDAQLRAGDSHGDIVFWPLAALADYLRACGDASLLDEVLPYHAAAGAPVQREAMSAHVARALAVVQARTIAGTHLAAYGHGDWNDALQPANPAMREQLCSAWTVTLHHRTLRALAAAWRQLARPAAAAAFEAQADAVAADFQRLLVIDGVVTGYAAFEGGAVQSYLLHPRDARTGLRYSALPMVHAIADELFSPAQAADHVGLIQRSLMGPDGLRLFDRPLAYQGGPMSLFQRGESASYFGREIGLMYMHAHLRWAEALAQLGRADDLLQALQLANPIGLSERVPQAAPRQRNCYHSSSDAAFADRTDASLHYDQIHSGQIALEGGWRIYSSGAGIAYRLVIQRLLGLTQQQHRLGLDPVLPAQLDGLVVQLPLYGQTLSVRYSVGPVGHGPLSVLLDAEPMPLQPGHNRYRRPGVWLDAGLLRARLAGGARHLHITLG